MRSEGERWLQFAGEDLQMAELAMQEGIYNAVAASRCATFCNSSRSRAYRYSFVANSSNSKFGQRPFLGRVET